MADLVHYSWVDGIHLSGEEDPMDHLPILSPLTTEKAHSTANTSLSSHTLLQVNLYQPVTRNKIHTLSKKFDSQMSPCKIVF